MWFKLHNTRRKKTFSPRSEDVVVNPPPRGLAPKSPPEVAPPPKRDPPELAVLVESPENNPPDAVVLAVLNKLEVAEV